MIWNSAQTPVNNPTTLNISSAMGNSDVFDSFLDGGAVQDDLLDGESSTSTIASAATRHEAWVCEVNLIAGTTDTAGDIKGGDSLTVLVFDVDDSTDTQFASPSALDLEDFDKDSAWPPVSSGTITLAHIDSFAVNDNSGDEFTRYENDEIDLSPGYNPDAFSRVDTVFTADSMGNPLVTNGIFVNVTISGGGDTEDFRDAYTNWLSGDINNTTDNEYSSGFGAIATPTSDADDKTLTLSGPGSLAAAGYALTPGFANGSFNSRGPVTLTGSGTACGARPADVDGNGTIDFNDLRAAIDARDSAAVSAVFEALSR